MVKNDDFYAFWRVLKAKWPFWAPPTPRNPKSYQKMLFPCPYGINTYNLGQKPRKTVKNSQKSYILVIFDIIRIPRAAQGVPEAGDPSKMVGSKNFYKNIKLCPQRSNSSIYIVLRSPWHPRTDFYLLSNQFSTLSFTHGAKPGPINLKKGPQTSKNYHFWARNRTQRGILG